MIGTLIYVLVVCIIIGLVFWIADYLPVPEPLNKLLKIVAIVIGVLIIIYALLSLGGMSGSLPSLK
jgi:preprotein translocase subunit SecE